MGHDQQQKTGDFSRVESLGYKFYRLARLFALALDKRLARHGVSIGQFRLLLVLWEREGLTQVEIARFLDIEQPTVARTLQRMQRDGLIDMSPDPADGRRLQISLTERGRALKVPLTQEAQFINHFAAQGLSVAEIAQLHKALDHLANALSDS